MNLDIFNSIILILKDVNCQFTSFKSREINLKAIPNLECIKCCLVKRKKKEKKEE